MKWDHGFYRANYRINDTSRSMFIVTSKPDMQEALDIFYRRANSSMELYEIETLDKRYDRLQIEYPKTLISKFKDIKQELIQKFSELTGYDVCIPKNYDSSLDTHVSILDTNTYVDSWEPDHVLELIEFLNSKRIKQFTVTPIPQQRYE